MAVIQLDRGVGTTQVFDCYFATDGLWPPEYKSFDEDADPWKSEKDPFLTTHFLSDGGPLEGVAMSMYDEKYPWLQIELAVEAKILKYVVVDIRKFKKHRQYN